jgi:hypothetical protein
MRLNVPHFTLLCINASDIHVCTFDKNFYMHTYYDTAFDAA